MIAGYKQQLLKLKDQCSVKEKVMTIKTTLFDIPPCFFRSGFTGFVLADNSTMSFAEFGKQRENFEFIKEFNRRN